MDDFGVHRPGLARDLEKNAERADRVVVDSRGVFGGELG